MDLLSRVAGWLGENEATISAVVGIMVLAGALFAGVRWLLLRGTGGTPEKLLPRPGRRTVPIAASAAVLLVVAGVVTWFVWPDDPTREIARKEDPLIALPTGPTVAVLPFANLSGDPEQEYFSDGLTEDLITDLSKISGLFVISRNSSFVYKGRPVRLGQVGRELGVRYVIEGSVQKAGDRLRVSAQLIDTTTDHHLWAERYDRRLEGIFDLQDDLSEKIVAALEVSLLQREKGRVEHPPTDSLEAYDHFLRGVTYHYRVTREANRRAGEMFERAIELDAQFALAQAALGWTYFTSWLFQWSDEPESLDRAFQLAHSSLELDDSLAVAHSLLAYEHLLNGTYEEAITASEKALTLNPNWAQGYLHLATMLNYAGRPEESVPFLRKAMRLDPHLSFLYRAGLGDSYRLIGRYEDAVVALKQALADNPDYLLAHLLLAATYSELNEEELARREASEVLRVSPGFTLEKHKHQRLLYRDRSEIERVVDALRKAGLPE